MLACMMQVCFIADAAALNHSTDSATPIMTVSTTDTEVDLITSIVSVHFSALPFER